MFSLDAASQKLSEGGEAQKRSEGTNVLRMA